MITFLFTVDVDQDGLTLDNERRALSWSAVDEVPALARLFHSRGAKVTWFLRADNQLSEVYGSAAWLHREFAPLWSELRDAGDAFAWHPHLYENNEPDYDDARCAAKLRRIHDELGMPFRAVRIGEGRHGNALMAALSELGLRVDCSAFPGRARNDAARRFDWSATPAQPYHPSASDYRVPGADPLPIIELPLTMIDIEAEYDPRPLPRYLNLAYQHEPLKRVLRAPLPAYVQSVIHPEEVRGGRPHGLYDFTLDNVARNLDYLLALAPDHRCATIDEVVPELEAALNIEVPA